MPERSWISHCIVPCPGNSSCEHCKPGEPHPKQHVFSKLVREPDLPQVPSSMTSFVEPPNVQYEKYLRRHELVGATFGNVDPTVPLDPKVDPQPHAYFICWSVLHMTRHCQEAATFVYCHNCGRRDVQVEDCPRCARAYREYREKRRCREEDRRQFSEASHDSARQLRVEDFEGGDAKTLVDETISRLKTEEKQRDECEEEGSWDEVLESKEAASSSEIRKQDEYEEKLWNDVDEEKHESVRVRKTYVTSTPTARIEETDVFTSSESYEDFRDAQIAKSNELFTFMRNQKMQDQFELDRIEREAALNSFSESESEYYFDDEVEENYDDYIVDEDEKSESLCSEDYAIRFFVDLLDALKHLSIDVQNTAVLNFVSTRKKQMAQIVS